MLKSLKRSRTLRGLVRSCWDDVDILQSSFHREAHEESRIVREGAQERL